MSRKGATNCSKFLCMLQTSIILYFIYVLKNNLLNCCNHLSHNVCSCFLGKNSAQFSVLQCFGWLQIAFKHNNTHINHFSQCNRFIVYISVCHNIIIGTGWEAGVLTQHAHDISCIIIGSAVDGVLAEAARVITLLDGWCNNNLY